MNEQQALISNHIEAQALLEEWIPLHLDHNHKTARQTEIEQAFMRLGVVPDCVLGVWVLAPMAYTINLDADEAIATIEALTWYASMLSAQDGDHEPSPENEATVAQLKRLLERLMPLVKSEALREQA